MFGVGNPAYGMVRMKVLARGHVWWPCLYDSVEGTVNSCEACQGNHKQLPPSPLQPWP